MQMIAVRPSRFAKFHDWLTRLFATADSDRPRSQPYAPPPVISHNAYAPEIVPAGEKLLELEPVGLGLGVDQLALICGPYDGDMLRLTDLLNLQKIHGMIVWQMQMPQAWIETYARHFAAAIVDFDHFPDATVRTAFLTNLGKFAPLLPVILLKQDHAEGECDGVPSMLYDLVLTKPVSQDALFDGLVTAAQLHRSKLQFRFLRRLG